ncbi:haloacid dehalogenase type II [Halopelagius longus]|uniref:2-haloacid dehalogenase n=1 Tax=Halopelagius longus TaxID=1236180 RepID=A0A1H1B5Z8_9EURY|nr:haloacid dehalogenase type II [Halopelagius longus]RDI70638.1 haloacid dehalogenase type II [Halopelagius longus]SDQ46826.1 2-haloacid dehalogenase [Halopelagius longus]
MSFDPDATETIAFDSYGTIVDVTAVAEPLSEHVESPEAVSKLWRNRSLLYATVGNAIGEYDSFFEMNRHALRYALQTLGVDLSEEEREEVLSTYHELPVFDDVHEGMERLHDAGYDLYVVSNGSEEMLESMVDHADLGDLIAETVSADEIQQFKPDPGLYEHAADRIGTPIEEITFVAAGWWDVPGAMNAGMQGVWVNRQDTLWGPYEADPDLTVETFVEFADELGV